MTDTALDLGDFLRRYRRGQDLTDREWAILIAIMDDGEGVTPATIPAWYVSFVTGVLEARK